MNEPHYRNNLCLSCCLALSLEILSGGSNESIYKIVSKASIGSDRKIQRYTINNDGRENLINKLKRLRIWVHFRKEQNQQSQQVDI